MDQFNFDGRTVVIDERTVCLHEISHALEMAELGYEIDYVRLGMHHADGHQLAGAAVLTKEAHETLGSSPEDNDRICFAGPAMEYVAMRRKEDIDIHVYLHIQLQRGWAGDAGESYLLHHPERAGDSLGLDEIHTFAMPRLQNSIDRLTPERVAVIECLADQVVARSEVTGEEFRQMVERARAENQDE